MLRRGLAVVAVALLATQAATAQGKGSCVSCHAALGTDNPISHSFADWEKSAHARSGVSCQACHGGDPASSSKQAAHAGLLRSTKPASRVYFTQIPKTCGTCHEPEFSAFRKSAHFKQLQSSGKGPNCVTCHGAMANSVLGGREMETTCALCHRQPTQAFAAHLQLSQAAAMVRSLEAALRKARASGAVELGPQQKAYREIQELQRSASIDWHTFQMSRVRSAASEVERRVTSVLGELKLKDSSAAPK